MKIENWSVTSTGDRYTPPELQRPALQGNIYGSERFADGSEMHTSAIVRAEGKTIMTASGSVYELGEVDPEWERLFPNSEARFWSSFDENGNLRTKPVDAE